MTIQVDANLFRLVYGAVSTVETRYHLNGVHIEAHPVKGAILVSTDGHRMIVAHDPEGVCDEAVIMQLPKFALALCKSPPLVSRRRIDIDSSLPGSATIQNVSDGKHEGDDPKIENVLTVHRVLIDGKFPDWRRVVPSGDRKTDTIAPTAFNPSYLKALGALGADIAKTVGGSGSLQVGLSDGGSPIVIRYAGAPNIFAIQMPMRFDTVNGFLPPFMDQPAQLQAAE